jgi:hypothetical protein
MVDRLAIYFSCALPAPARQRWEPLLSADTLQNQYLQPEYHSGQRHLAFQLTASLPCLMVIAAAALLPPHALAAEGATKPRAPFAVPLPPPHSDGSSVPRGTSTPSLAAPAVAETAPQKEALRPPRHLPPASRTRMHACGLEWQKAKETGLAANKTWFEFAQVCLTK